MDEKSLNSQCAKFIVIYTDAKTTRIIAKEAAK